MVHQVNVLQEDLMTEVVKVLNDIQSNPAVRSAVFISAKPTGFIAGADIRMLQACKNENDGYKISKSGQEILARIENSNKPIVAAVHGSCLGGGLEVRYYLRLSQGKSKLFSYVPEIFFCKN